MCDHPCAAFARCSGAGGKAVEVYKTNGMIIEKGITVGELGRRIMEGIYGSGIEEDNGRKLENERKEVAL